MFSPRVCDPTQQQFYVNPYMPTVSDGCECDAHEGVCPCIGTRRTENEPQNKEEDPKRYRWLFLAITLPFIIFAALAALFKKKDPPDGPDGGGTGGDGRQRPDDHGRPNIASPSNSLREIVTMPMQMMETGTMGMGAMVVGARTALLGIPSMTTMHMGII